MDKDTERKKFHKKLFVANAIGSLMVIIGVFVDFKVFACKHVNTIILAEILFTVIISYIDCSKPELWTDVRIERYKKKASKSYTIALITFKGILSVLALALYCFVCYSKPAQVCNKMLNYTIQEVGTSTMDTIDISTNVIESAGNLSPIVIATPITYILAVIDVVNEINQGCQVIANESTDFKNISITIDRIDYSEFYGKFWMTDKFIDTYNELSDTTDKLFEQVVDLKNGTLLTEERISTDGVMDKFKECFRTLEVLALLFAVSLFIIRHVVNSFVCDILEVKFARETDLASR